MGHSQSSLGDSDAGGPARENAGPPSARARHLASRSPAASPALPEKRALHREATFHVDDLDCRGCAKHAERALRRAPGVREARVGFIGELAQVVYDVGQTSERQIIEAMQRAGFRMAHAFGAPPSERITSLRTRLSLSIILFANLLAVGVASAGDPGHRGPWFAKLGLAAAIVALAAPPILRRAGALLRRGVVGRDAMVAAGALGAFVLGVLELAYATPGSASAPEWLASLGFHPEPWGTAAKGFEAAGGILVFALAVRALAAHVHGRAQRGLAEAARDRAAVARRVDGEGREAWVPREALALGDRVRLLEGETAPTDLRLEADARVNEVGAFAEAVASDRPAGEVMRRGGVLLSGHVIGRVARPYRAALAAAMDAEAYRAVARIDQEATLGADADGTGDVAARSLCIATLTFAVFALLSHAALRGGPAHVGAWLAAVAVLVGASPAAFAVAAPLARSIAVLTARAGGVLVKDIAALEALAGVDAACLDKTGTVTSGDLRVTGITWVAGVPDRRVLEDVLAIERLALHRAGRAVAAYLGSRGISAPAAPPSARVVESGDGISARLRDATYEIGAARRFGRPEAPDAPAAASLIWFGRNGQPLGYFEIVDALRPGAQAALRSLWQRGVACRLLSGDRPEATLATAHRLGVPGAGGLGASEKALHVRDLQHAGSRVLFVGDGRAREGGAAHADVALAVAPATLPGALAAPLVLTEACLDRIPWLVDLSRSLRANLRQSTAVAIAFNAVVIPLATLGMISPLQAASLALGEAVLVIANAARLLRLRAPAAEPAPAVVPLPVAAQPAQTLPEPACAREPAPASQGAVVRELARRPA